MTNSESNNVCIKYKLASCITLLKKKRMKIVYKHITTTKKNYCLNKSIKTKFQSICYIVLLYLSPKFISFHFIFYFFLCNFSICLTKFNAICWIIHFEFIVFCKLKFIQLKNHFFSYFEMENKQTKNGKIYIGISDFQKKNQPFHSFIHV